MKSIGISINQVKDKDKITEDDDYTIQLHLNLWKSPEGFHQFRQPYVLDIGIMAKFATNKICLYLPYAVRKKHCWTDLGRIIIENRPILCSLFNEDFNIIKVEGSCYYKVRPNCNGDQPENSSALFYIYGLGESDIEIVEFENKTTPGVILKINVPNHEDIKSSERFYIRLRIPITSYKQLALRSNLANNPLQAAFVKLDMYNIQINEQREIPSDSIGILKSDNFIFPKFSKIHFLYVANPMVDVDNGSFKECDSRLVDPNNWMAYIPDRCKAKSYLAYHWRMPREDEKCVKKASLFFKAKYPKMHLSFILAYCIAVILLGCGGSILASLLCESNTVAWVSPGKTWVLILGGYFILWCLYTNRREIWSFIKN